MKNIITVFISVITSVLIGLSFMDISNEPEVPASNINDSLIALQLGAYKDEESARNFANNNDAIVIKDNEYFYVYRAILTDSSNIERMMQILDESNIYYYAKEIEPNNLYQEELLQYEELMKKCTSDIAFLKLIEQSLVKYEVYNEN